MLIGLFTKGWERHAATLLLVATPFYTFNAYKYNANTIFISLWPWTLYFFIRSADLMSRRDALIFGVFAAACILSKYYAVLLLATCGLSLFVASKRAPVSLFAAALDRGRRLLFVGVAAFVSSLTSSAPPVAYAMGLTGKGWLFSRRARCALCLRPPPFPGRHRGSCFPGVGRNPANFGLSSRPGGAQAGIAKSIRVSTCYDPG